MRSPTKRQTDVQPLLVLVLLLVLDAAGCSDFDPPEYLQDLRVLALSSEPVEAVLDEELRLQAYSYVPPGERVVRETWRFCPLTAGPRGGYACLLSDCEVTLEPDADGAVRARPGLLAVGCLLAAGGDAPAGTTAEELAELPDPVEVVFGYRAETDAGSVREAVLRVALWTRSEPEQRNRAPVIESIELDGRVLDPSVPLAPVRAGDALVFTVRVDPESLDAYVDEAGRERVEEPILSFFATAGRFEARRKAGTVVEIEWKAKSLEDDESAADLYVVARDLRGGQVVTGPYHVPIVR